MRGDDAKYIQSQIFWISSWIITRKRGFFRAFFLLRKIIENIFAGF